MTVRFNAKIKIVNPVTSQWNTVAGHHALQASGLITLFRSCSFHCGTAWCSKKMDWRADPKSLFCMHIKVVWLFDIIIISIGKYGFWHALFTELVSSNSKLSNYTSHSAWEVPSTNFCFVDIPCTIYFSKSALNTCSFLNCTRKILHFLNNCTGIISRNVHWIRFCQLVTIHILWTLRNRATIFSIFCMICKLFFSCTMKSWSVLRIVADEPHSHVV